MRKPRPATHRERDRAYRLRNRARPLSRAESLWLRRYDARKGVRELARSRAKKARPLTAREEAVAIASWAADYMAPDESPHPIMSEWHRSSTAKREGYARASTEWAEPVDFEAESAEPPLELPIGNHKHRNANIQVLIAREESRTGQSWSSVCPLTPKWESLHAELYKNLKALFKRYVDAGALLGVSVQVSPRETDDTKRKFRNADE